jgi:tripartite-type tricarboxylate transporter receptor subunit TctC
MKCISFMMIATITAVGMGTEACASDWPSRPVRIVAPAAPGGASDLLGRILAPHLSEILNQQFYIENRGGAGGLIGSALVANAPPDGYTFLTSNVGYIVTAPMTAAKPPFDPLRDFTHVAYIGGPPNVFVVHPSIGVKTLQGFLDYARKQDVVDYVSAGAGTLGNLMAERFAAQTGIKLQHILGKGGGPAMIDVVSGTVKFCSITYSSALGQMRAGTVVPLAVSSAERMPEFPSVPTLKELGYPEFVDTVWFGLSGPANLPKDIVERLNTSTYQVLQMPEIQKRMAEDGIETGMMTPADFTSFIANEVMKWSPIAKRKLQ